LWEPLHHSCVGFRDIPLTPWRCFGSLEWSLRLLCGLCDTA
jgi:hypothetical protein